MDFMHRILRGCLIPTNTTSQVPTLKSLSTQATAFWAVCSLHTLHDSPGQSRASSDDIMKAVKDHITCRIPSNLVDDFVVQVLHAMDVAFEQSGVGRQLLVYVGSFIPRNLRAFLMPLCLEQVTIAAILTLPLCTNLTELYMERADQSVITQGILCHVLKYLRKLKALALPKQCNDSVIAVVGQNCPLLESIVLNDTGVTNTGVAWLLCCRKLHTVIMLKTEVSPPGAALLLYGLPYLCALLYDSIADTLWYCSVHSAHYPKFALRTVAFGPSDSLTPGHLELLAHMCPGVEWLFLNSAFTYNVQALGPLAYLTLFNANLRGGNLDVHFENFLSRNGSTIKCLQLLEASEIEWRRLERCLRNCPLLETLVITDSTWEKNESHNEPKPIPSIQNLQIFRTALTSLQLQRLVSALPNLCRFEIDVLDLDEVVLKRVLARQAKLDLVRVGCWKLGGHAHTVGKNQISQTVRSALRNLQNEFPLRDLELDGQFLSKSLVSRSSPQALMAEYAEMSPLLDISKICKN